MGKFDWFKKIGATDEAVATLNDQPELFTTLILVILGLAAQGALLWFIHHATFKPEQRKNKKPGKLSFLTKGFKRGVSDNARGGAGRS